MFLDPSYINLWIPFVFVCALALVVFTALLIMILIELGQIADEFKRFNGNEEKLYPLHVPDSDDDEGWKVDLFDERDNE